MMFNILQGSSKHFIPNNAITCSIVKDDIVACVLLLYNPETRCPLHVHAYRLDSELTAHNLNDQLQVFFFFFYLSSSNIFFLIFPSRFWSNYRRIRSDLQSWKWSEWKKLNFSVKKLDNIFKNLQSITFTYHSHIFKLVWS